MVECVVCVILIGVCLVVWWLRGLVFITEWWAGVTAVVGLGFDVAVGVWEPIGLEVTVNKGQDSVL